MKNVLILFSLFFCSLSLSAQTTAGTFLVHANASSLQFSSLSADADGYGENESKEFEMDFALGYFFIDNLFAGVYTYVSTEEINDSEFNQVAIGPMARYYFLPGNLKPFGEIAILFGNTEVNNFDNSLFLTRINAGAEFFITKGFAAGAKLGIGFGNSESEGNIDSSLFEFNFGLGFSILF